MFTRTVFSVVVLALLPLLAAVDGFNPAPQFTLDLGLPPFQRWKGAVGLVLKHHPYNESFGPFFTLANQSVFQHLTEEQVATVIARVATMTEHFEELQGIAAEFAAIGHPEVDITYLSLWSWWHELDHASDLDQGNLKECTGVLVLPEDKSLPIIHGRNLDQDTYSGRNITLQINVVNSSRQGADKDTILFQAVDIYWYTTGFVTATSLNRLTLEENWRSNDVNPAQTLAQIIARINHTDVSAAPAFPQVLMFRHLLQRVTAETEGPAAFDEAIKFLTTTSFAAPFYAIVSGAGRRGAVVSVAWNQSFTHIAYLNDTSYQQDGKWHLVQTNYDRWTPFGKIEVRRVAAETALNSLGRTDGATKVGVWMTISEYPVHNRHTMYSLLMMVTEVTRGIVRRVMQPYDFEGRYAHYPN